MARGGRAAELALSRAERLRKERKKKKKGEEEKKRSRNDICNFIHESRRKRTESLLFFSLWRERVASGGGLRRRRERRLHGGRRRRRRGLLLLLLLLLLPLREARRRSRESPDPRHAAAPEAVPHGRRLLLELSSSGIRSVRAELIRVGRGLSGIHLYDAAAVGGTRRSRSRRGRRGDYPPVEPVIQHGQRREDAGLEPREKDNGRARAGLGEAVVCV